jgi:uncharacterized protein
MIMDCNCLLGEWPFRRMARGDAAGLLELMDGYGIAQAWVGAVEGIFYRDMTAANELLLERISGHEDRLLPWAVINPAFPGWEEDLQEAEAAGCVGLRLYPNYHGYELTDGCLTDVLGAARALCWPVALYHKVQDERLHHWRMPVPAVDMSALPAIVEQCPDLPLLICGQSLQFAEQYRGLFAGTGVSMEISRLEGIGGVGDLIGTIGAEHVVFGSHAPFFYLEAALLKVQEGGLSEADRDLVLHENAARLLRGPRPG